MQSPRDAVSRVESRIGSVTPECRGSALFLRDIHTFYSMETGLAGWIGRMREGSAVAPSGSAVLPDRGEHYLNPARIDAKGLETRMSRRGDVVDSHEFDLISRDRGRGHHLRNECEPSPCAERHGNQDALDAQMRTHRSEQLFVAIDAWTAQFVDHSRFRSVEGAYDCLRDIFDV